MLFVLQLFNRQSSCAGIRVWPCAYTGHIQVQQWVWVNTCFRLYINIHVVWQNMPYTHLYWFQWEWVRLLVCEMADLKRWLKFSLGTGINCRAPRQTRLIILNQFGQVNRRAVCLRTSSSWTIKIRAIIARTHKPEKHALKTHYYVMTNLL